MRISSTFFTLIATLALLAPTLAAADQPAERLEFEELLGQVQNHYEAVGDYVADFTQVYQSAALGDERSSRGQVFFKKPGQMRWDYASPQERYLISDGQTLWVYEPAFGQYYQESLQNSQLPVALRFLMGEGKLSDDFVVDPGAPAPDGEAWLALTPRRSEGQLRELHLRVSRDTGAVLEVVIYDPLGNINRITFESTRENVSLPVSGFTFEPPEGATRVEGPGR